MNGAENTAIDMSTADKFIIYILKSVDVYFFLIRIIITDIFVMKATKAVSPYSRAKTVGKGLGSATDQTTRQLY